MASAPSGWYDDPADPDSLRYWDGVMWTSHVVPKMPANLGDSHLSNQPAWTGAGSGPHGTGYRHDPGSTPAKSTQAPDGTPLSGWWRRVGALVIDNLLLSTVVLVLGWPWLGESLEQFSQWWMAAVRNPSSDLVPRIPDRLLSTWISLTLLVALVHVGYEIIGLSRWGVTVGRLVTGIRVRDVSGAIRLPLSTAVRRTGVKFLGDLTAAIPVLSFLTGLFALLDKVWPLWDPRRQALHDKAADTQVILAPSRRSGAPPGR